MLSGEQSTRLRDLLQSRKVALDARQTAVHQEFWGGFDLPALGPDGEKVTIDPKVKARYTPKPYPWPVLDLLDRRRERAVENPVPKAEEQAARWDRLMRLKAWKDAFDHYDTLRATKPVIYLFGAGASTLDLDLSPLDGQVVFGINFTRQWFDPTFLQIADQRRYDGEIKTKVYKAAKAGVQPITSQWAYDTWITQEEKEPWLTYEVYHAITSHQAHTFSYADWPAQPMTHYSNSLGWALNVAAWFRPAKIVMLGFDWGGLHFFGDGRKVNAAMQYGVGGMDRPNLMPQLYELRRNLEWRGLEVVQVGPTKLPVWQDRHYDSIQEAIKA